MSKSDDPPNSPEDHFAANLRALREHRGRSQESLAKQMTERGYKWHQATVYKVESGERRVQLGEATAVAAILGVPVDKMAEGTGDIIALSEIKSLVAELQDLRGRLERNARAYEMTRHSLRAKVDQSDPWSGAGVGVLSMLTEQERQEIDEAVALEADTIARQPPF